jgi:hypothetical protein
MKDQISITINEKHMETFAAGEEVSMKFKMLTVKFVNELEE